ncbi:hypothetical protein YASMINEVIRUS_682 [Yasminevirus sp. GU-2018]|uniref:Uncharacterized protein n=1 Tax=Yasminevirus sp. GU-2018 TaxID=2420051 RepID=A0A5K0U815_9VIRU|nr:hypothetical protein YASMINEVIRUS_682 [Yasminevirus sp. GU-2018]
MILSFAKPPQLEHRTTMADKFSASSSFSSGGSPIAKWMNDNVVNQPSLNKGPVVTCYDIDGVAQDYGLNRVGLLMKDCRFMRQGTSSNHGMGGSNCSTGTPVAFVDLVTVFPAVFSGEFKGYLRSYSQHDNLFVIPLCQIADAPDMKTMMLEGHAEFIALRKGNTAHDDSHIANSLCCSLAATMFSLCEEITLKGSKPNVQRITFLVEALHTLGITAHNVARAIPECDNIFRLMPYVAQTADTFQSTLMAFIFDEMPPLAVRVKQVQSSIFRHFNNTSWSASYVDNTPPGLIGLLLIAPMMGGLITSELTTVELINKIVRSVNKAVTTIVERLASGELRHKYGRELTHAQNKLILHEFASASEVPQIPVAMVEKVYDAVLAGCTNVAKELGIDEHAHFEQPSVKFVLNKTNATTYAILRKLEKLDEKGETGRCSATYLPSEPREWTGLSLKPGVYRVTAKPVGMAKFGTGNTRDQLNVANFRFTAGTDLLTGLYPGYSSAGIYWNPATRSFTEARDHSAIDPSKPFDITCLPEGILIEQNGQHVLRIGNGGNIHLAPVVCFKLCEITVEYVKQAEMLIPRKVTPTLSFAQIAKGKGGSAEAETPATVEDASPIESVLNLSESLQNLKVTGTRGTRESYGKRENGSSYSGGHSGSHSGGHSGRGRGGYGGYRARPNSGWGNATSEKYRSDATSYSRK